MIKSGERYAQQARSKSPLMYQWYDTEYLGAAHGLTGIVYLLLSVRCNALQQYVNLVFRSSRTHRSFIYNPMLHLI
jgi:hypothetical protein